MRMVGKASTSFPDGTCAGGVHTACVMCTVIRSRVLHLWRDTRGEETRNFGLAIAFVGAVAVMALPSILGLDHYFATVLRAINLAIAGPVQ